ncbi:hypothetical protein J2T18_001589 [Paenibacillus polymyxa]|nr:hypothetical protein [Paenibacillus polymyxa]
MSLYVAATSKNGERPYSVVDRRRPTFYSGKSAGAARQVPRLERSRLGRGWRTSRRPVRTPPASRSANGFGYATPEWIRATKMIKQHWPHIRVLIVTTFQDAEQALDLLRSGADGFLLKSAEPLELADTPILS